MSKTGTTTPKWVELTVNRDFKSQKIKGWNYKFHPAGDLLDLYVKAPKFDRIFRVLLENHFMQQQERMGQLFSSTAEERYLSFLEQYKHLFNRLPNTQIASYLGITPEFLSKIRKNLQSKG